MRWYPITDGPRSKRGRYFIFDSFYSFWFRYVHPNIDLIEVGDMESLRRMVLNELEYYVSKVFEDIVRDTLLAMCGRFGREYGLPVLSKIGAWWDRRGNEIDIVGMYKDKVVLVGEAKYISKPVTAKEVVKFVEKLRFIKTKGATKIYVSRRGFTRSALEVMAEENIIGLKLDELVYIWEKLSRINH